MDQQEKSENFAMSKNTQEASRLSNERPSNVNSEGQARLTTEAHTDLLEKVIITNDIVIAWPIRLSGVCVMEHDPEGQQQHKQNEPNQQNAEPEEEIMRHTVSMSVQLDGLLGQQNLNIQTRVKIRSSSPEYNLTIQNTFGPATVNESDPVNSESTQLQPTNISPTDNERFTNQWRITTTGSVQSPTPDPVSKLVVNGIEVTSPAVTSVEMQRNQTPISQADDMAQPEQNLPILTEPSLPVTDAASDQLPPEYIEFPKEGKEEIGEKQVEQLTTADPTPYENVTKSESDVQEVGESNPDIQEINAQAEGTDEASIGNPRELIDGQSIMHDGEPQQLVQSEMPGTDPVDLKVDSVVVSPPEEHMEIKMGHVDSASSQQYEQLKTDPNEGGNDQQTAVPIVAENAPTEVDPNSAGPDNEPVAQSMATSNITETNKAVEQSEVDGILETDKNVAEVATDSSVEPKTLEQQEQNESSPTNAPVNVQDIRTLSIHSTESHHSVNADGSECKNPTEVDEPVVVSAPDIQHTLNTTKQDDPVIEEEAVWEAGVTAANLSPVEGEELQHLSTVQTIDAGLSENEPEVAQPDQSVELNQIKAFHLTESSKKSNTEASGAYRETAKELVQAAILKTADKITEESGKSSVTQADTGTEDKQPQELSDRSIAYPNSEASESQPKVAAETNQQTVEEDLASNDIVPTGLVSAPSDGNMEPSNKTEQTSAQFEATISHVKTEPSIASSGPMSRHETPSSSPHLPLAPTEQPQITLRDAEVNTKLSPQSDEAEEHEESEWSHSTHRYRHYYHHYHGGRPTRTPAATSPNRGVHKRIGHHHQDTRHMNHEHRRVRSRTLPRLDGNMCGCDHCTANKVYGEVQTLERRSGSGELGYGEENSDETSSGTQTSETSEIQKVTMTLLNTLTTTAELLRNQYRRRKAHAAKASVKALKKQANSGQNAAGQQHTDANRAVDPTPDEKPVAAARNASCAVPEPRQRSRTTVRKCRVGSHNRFELASNGVTCARKACEQYTWKSGWLDQKKQMFVKSKYDRSAMWNYRRLGGYPNASMNAISEKRHRNAERVAKGEELIKTESQTRVFYQKPESMIEEVVEEESYDTGITVHELAEQSNSSLIKQNGTRHADAAGSTEILAVRGLHSINISSHMQSNPSPQETLSYNKQPLEARMVPPCEKHADGLKERQPTATARIPARSQPESESICSGKSEIDGQSVRSLRYSHTRSPTSPTPVILCSSDKIKPANSVVVKRTENGARTLSQKRVTERLG